MPADPRQPRPLGQYLALAAAGMELVLPAMLGALLDAYMGWGYWAALTGLVVGFAAGLTHMVWLLKRFEEPPQPPQQGAP